MPLRMIGNAICMRSALPVRSQLARLTLGIAMLSLVPAVPGCAQELMPGSSGWSGFAARPDSSPALLTSAGSPYALEIIGNGVATVPRKRLCLSVGWGGEEGEADEEDSASHLILQRRPEPGGRIPRR